MPKCRRDQIINPKTNRCVLKRGKIGQQVLAQKRGGRRVMTMAKENIKKDIINMGYPFNININEVRSSIHWNATQRTLQFYVKPYQSDNWKMPQSAHKVVATQVEKLYKQRMQKYLNDCFSNRSPWKVSTIRVVGDMVQVILISSTGTKQFPKRNPYYNVEPNHYLYGWDTFEDFIIDLAGMNDGKIYYINWPLCRKQTQQLQEWEWLVSLHEKNHHQDLLHPYSWWRKWGDM